MPRKPRFYLPGVPAHIVQRGNGRQATFFDDADYARYLGWLREGAKREECAIHAYVLMTNHVHLLVTPQDSGAISRLIQFVGRRYVTYVNDSYARTGTLWEGRHKGCVISGDGYLLACMRYIELNPVRAGMAASPGDYRWSSYRVNSVGGDQGAITPHPVYLALGQDRDARGEAYRKLFRIALDPDGVRSMRATVQTGTPLGNDRFRQQIEKTVRRPVGQARRGRPAKVEGKGY